METSISREKIEQLTLWLQILHWLATYGRRGFEPIWDDDKLMNAVPSIWEKKSLFDFHGHSPLHLAAVAGNALAIPPLAKRLKEAQSLTDGLQRSPLHLAAREGNHEVVRALLDEGWEVDPKDSRGRTPLMYAARAGDGFSLHELLQSGADMQARDVARLSALQHAARQRHVIILAVMVATKKVFLSDVQETLADITDGDQVLADVRKKVANNAPVDTILNAPDTSDSESYEQSDDDRDGSRQKHSGRSSGLPRRSSSQSSSPSDSDSVEVIEDDDYDEAEPRSPRESSQSKRRGGPNNFSSEDDDSDGESVTISYADIVVSDGAKPKPKANGSSAKRNPYASDSDSDSDKFSDEEKSDTEDDKRNGKFSDSEDEAMASLVSGKPDKGIHSLASGGIFDSKRSKHDDNDDDSDGELDFDNWDDEDTEAKAASSIQPFAVKRAGSAGKLHSKADDSDASDTSEAWNDFDDVENEISEPGLRFAVKKAGAVKLSTGKALTAKNADEAGEESWDDDFAEAGDVRSEATAPVASAAQLPSTAAIRQLLGPTGGGAKKTLTPEMFAAMTGGATPKHGTPPVPRRASGNSIESVSTKPPKPITIVDDSDDDDWAADDDDEDDESSRAKAAAARKASLESADGGSSHHVVAKRPPPPTPAAAKPQQQNIFMSHNRQMTEDEIIADLLSEPVSAVGSSPVDTLSEAALVGATRSQDSKVSVASRLMALADELKRRKSDLDVAEAMTSQFEKTVRALLPDAPTAAEAKRRYAEIVSGHLNLSQISVTVNQLQLQVAQRQKELLEATEARRRARQQLSSNWAEYFRQQDLSTAKLERLLSATVTTQANERQLFGSLLIFFNALALFVLGFIAAVTFLPLT